ncbi:MAG: GNAT family N-acetyltransferase [bacterium]|nr:GNAT family N-acetyltransferase [bacterium]
MSEPTEALADGVEVHLATDDDRTPQAGLYDTCFEKSDGETVVPWRYQRCPHGQPVSFVASRDGALISSYACSPRTVLSFGDDTQAATVGETGDVMTHPDHRRMGIFSVLDRQAMAETAERGWTAVFGLPNRRSAHIFTDQLGWSSVGSIRPWTFVLTTDEGAKRERMRAGRLAALAVPWTYWRGTMRRGKLRNEAWEKVNTVPLPRFDQEVDGLALEVAKQYPFMVRRDHEYLNWRFIDAPSGRFKAHGVYEPSGALRGYCVVQLPATGEPVGFVADLLALDEVAFAAAMEAALGHLAKAGASVARAYAIEGSWWERQLQAAGFRAPKKDDAKIVIAYVHDASHPIGKAMLEPASWYFTDGDRDDELVS